MQQKTVIVKFPETSYKHVARTNGGKDMRRAASWIIFCDGRIVSGSGKCFHLLPLNVKSGKTSKKFSKILLLTV